jgi:hypothetical protein
MLCAALAPLLAIEQDNTHVTAYVPHVVDGGPATERWQTSVTVSNYNDTPARLDFRFFNNSGQRWQLTFGGTTDSGFTATVPAGAVRTFFTSGTSSGTLNGGWLAVISSLPVQLQAGLRLSQNEQVQLDLPMQPVLPGLGFSGVIAGSSVLSVANTIGSPITVSFTLLDRDGRTVKEGNLEVPGFGRRQINVAADFGIDTNFSGSFRAEVSRPSDAFVMAALARDGLGALNLRALARLTYPMPHVERMLLVYRKVLQAARTMRPEADWENIEFRVGGEREINAFAANGRVVQINLALAELISDSQSELAQVIAHELGHIYQQRTRRLEYNENPEFDADVWGLFLALGAGYDPYAMAGSLAKLAMVTGRSGLTQQFEDQVSGDAHQSFNTRLENLYDTLQIVCSLPGVKSACEEYKGVFHPTFPGNAPLGRPAPIERAIAAEGPRSEIR